MTGSLLLIDSFGRRRNNLRISVRRNNLRISVRRNNLRVSVTGRCNIRCFYGMRHLQRLRADRQDREFGSRVSVDVLEHRLDT